MAAHQSNRQADRLIHESNPYLLQHAHDPVDWHPWVDEALAKALAENKLVSLGYNSCHWCHVMERECFEDPAITGPDTLQLRRAFGTHHVPTGSSSGASPPAPCLYCRAVPVPPARTLYASTMPANCPLCKYTRR